MAERCSVIRELFDEDTFVVDCNSVEASQDMYDTLVRLIERNVSSGFIVLHGSTETEIVVRRPDWSAKDIRKQVEMGLCIDSKIGGITVRDTTEKDYQFQRAMMDCEGYI